MTTVAIICEYNPFHNGHKHHVDEIRRVLGADTQIVAIMSGSFTQRGESAVMDKTDRARCAVECGVNLVLELPFPFSMSCAELFARAGVTIADRLGIVDYLSFGSESGDISALSEYARRCTTPEYCELLEKNLRNESLASLGYPRVCELTYSALFKDGEIASTPNNILAIEYIKALSTLGSRIKPHTVKRMGASYDESELLEGEYQSASAIRRSAFEGSGAALDYVPAQARAIIRDAKERGAFPCDMERLAPAVLSFFRLSPTDASSEIHDAKGGLYNRLKNSSFEANTIKALVSLSETKKYTNARILRAIWYSFFGVTSSEVKEAPAYTQLLAMDGIGRACLKEIRKRGSIAVLTKPSNIDTLSDTAKRQKECSDRADSIFHLTRPYAASGRSSLTFTPYVKE